MNYKNISLSALLMLFSFSSFAQVVGNDRDEHNCIGSAGYTYSEIKKECIRIFEQKLLLTDTDASDNITTQTCVLFSADNKKAEIFLNGGNIVLNRKGKKGSYTWEKGDIVLGNDKGYFIKKAGTIIYKVVS